MEDEELYALIRQAEASGEETRLGVVPAPDGTPGLRFEHLVLIVDLDEGGNTRYCLALGSSPFWEREYYSPEAVVAECRHLEIE